MESVDTSDLQHLSYIELLEEKVKVRASIADLVAEKRVSGRPDDILYRKWLRRTNAELSRLVRRHDQIRLMLAKRQQEGAKVTHQPSAPSAWTEEQKRQRAALVADIETGGPDALLVRVRRLMTNLCGGIPIDDLPIDEDDRKTLRDMSIYLRRRYGSRALKDVLHGVAS